MTGWVLHCSKTFTSVFITTDKLCEGFGQGLATVSQLSQQLPLLIRSWPTNRSDFTRVSRYFTREICRVSICIWTCSHAFSAFGVLCVTDSALNTIKVHDSSHHRVDFSTGTTMCLFLPTVHHRCPGWADRKETPSFTRILRTALCSASRSSACTPYLLVLVGSDRGEHSLREAEHLEDAPADTEEVICLHDVEARLVTVHGVQDDLGQTKDKVSMCKHCQHATNLLWRLPGHPFQTRDACWDWCLHQAPVVTVQAHAFPSRELRGHEGRAEGGRKGTWICFNFYTI